MIRYWIMRTVFWAIIFFFLMFFWSAVVRWLFYEAPEQVTAVAMGVVLGGFTVAIIAVRWPESVILEFRPWWKQEDRSEEDE